MDWYEELVEKSCWNENYYGIVPNYMKDMKYTTYIEIGGGLGQHAKQVKEIGAHVWIVDPYQPYDNDNFNDIICLLPISNSWDTLAERVQQESGAILIREPSQKAVSRFLDNSIDCIFIDGEHSYEAVKADLNAWWKKVKIGGTLIGDDYWMDDVNFAVSEFVKQNNLSINFMAKPESNYVLFYLVKE